MHLEGVLQQRFTVFTYVLNSVHTVLYTVYA